MNMQITNTDNLRADRSDPTDPADLIPFLTAFLCYHGLRLTGGAVWNTIGTRSTSACWHCCA